MKRYTVVVSGSATVDVVAKTAQAAESIVEKLCGGELAASVERTLDKKEVDAVLSLGDWEVLDAWPAPDTDTP